MSGVKCMTAQSGVLLLKSMSKAVESSVSANNRSSLSVTWWRNDLWTDFSCEVSLTAEQCSHFDFYEKWKRAQVHVCNIQEVSPVRADHWTSNMDDLSGIKERHSGAGQEPSVTSGQTWTISHLNITCHSKAALHCWIILYQTVLSAFCQNLFTLFKFHESGTESADTQHYYIIELYVTLFKVLPDLMVSFSPLTETQVFSAPVRTKCLPQMSSNDCVLKIH